MRGPGQNFRAVREFFRFARVASGLWRAGVPNADDAIESHSPRAHSGGPPDSSSNPAVNQRLAVSEHLLAQFVIQQNDRSCSIASAAMVVNAARSLRSGGGPPYSQAELLDIVGVPEWKAAVGPGGNGVILDHLAELVGQALRAFGIGVVQIATEHVDGPSPAARARLRNELRAASNSEGHFVIANFLQGELTGNGIDRSGHYAPVGGYDEAAGRMLILDPDRRGFGPYWVSEDRLLAGLATLDASCSQSRGYLSVKIAGPGSGCGSPPSPHALP
jgi:hypothetical protein